MAMIVSLKLEAIGTIIFFMAGSVIAGPETTSVSIDRSSERVLAQRIFKATDVRGGLIVHVGCGNGRLTAELHAGDSYIVHALDENAENVSKAREYIRSLGKYGAITAMHWTRRELPYADNLVNLLISENLGAIPIEEVMRVLVPRGVAYIRKGATWTKTVKPWPNDIDEWTHWLHGPDGNAVADDKIVGPPRHLQWTAGPMWSRHHDTVPSTSAMVSSHGRIFSIIDEAPAGIDGSLPDRWFLVARDAFNGILLWKRPMPQWGWQQWSAKWEGRFNQPTQLAKRLVAIDDTVYVTLGFNAPLTAIDAATGRIIKTYDGTTGTDEILYHEGRLILSVNKVSQKPKDNKAPAVRKGICVIEADSGKLLWKRGDYRGLRARADAGEPFGRVSIAVGDGQLFMMDRNAVISLNLTTGKEIWRTPRPEVPEFLALFGTRMNDMCVLLYSNGILLYAQPEMEKRDPWHSIPGSLYALSAKGGRQLWKHRYGGWMHFGQPDVFVIDGLVWIHEHKEITEGKGKSRHYIPDQDKLTYAVIGLDPETGDIKQRFSTQETFNVGHHHRCYRNKSTSRFLLMSRRGVEFLNLDTGKNLLHHWARGACLYGILPCNGLLYLTPHPCECFIASKLNGYFALAPEIAHKQSARRKHKGRRLIRGPAFTDGGSKGISPVADDWPTFRHDARRSGSTKSTVPADLKPLWQADVGDKVSPVVVANGKLFITSIDEHRVIAFDAANGTEAWSFTAAGRVDTPPTVYRHLVLFGSADGWVYCLRASDGECAWRFRAAPDSRLIGAFGQLESPWPVHGSILVEDDVAYFAAGRSSYLDEGIYVYALDPQTGRIIKEQVIYSPDPQTGEMPPGDAFILPGALADIMVSDGKSIYMRENRIFGDMDTGTEKIGNTVFSTAGFRDETWFNRTHWVVGTVSQAQLLVFDDNIAYGVGAYWDAKRKNCFHPGKQEYMLFASDFKSSPSRKPLKKTKFGRVIGNPETRWMVSVPICVKAMAIADKTLFIAGAPDVVDPDDPLGALEGRKGARLWAVSASDGKRLAEYDLDALPVWDGMAAANRRLYLSTKDGRVLCFAGQ